MGKRSDSDYRRAALATGAANSADRQLALGGQVNGVCRRGLAGNSPSEVRSPATTGPGERTLRPGCLVGLATVGRWCRNERLIQARSRSPSERGSRCANPGWKRSDVMALRDFSDPKELACWSAITDAVMGGRSRSRMHFDPAGDAVFSGTVSLENNGGLASVLRQPGDLGTARAPYRKSCRSAPLSAERQVTDTQLAATSRFPKYSKGRGLAPELALVSGRLEM